MLHKTCATASAGEEPKTTMMILETGMWTRGRTTAEESEQLMDVVDDYEDGASKSRCVWSRLEGLLSRSFAAVAVQDCKRAWRGGRLVNQSARALAYPTQSVRHPCTAILPPSVMLPSFTSLTAHGQPQSSRSPDHGRGPPRLGYACRNDV